MKIRFTILLGILCAGLGLGLFVLHHYEERETRLILEKVRSQRSELLDRINVLLGEPLEQFVAEYAQWTEMVDFVEAGPADPAWVKINLQPALENYQAQVIWVLKPNGELITRVDPEGAPDHQVPRLPDPASLVAQLERSGEIHYFYEANDEVYELWGGPIVTSEGWTETAPAHGYLIIGRAWNRSFLDKFAKLLGCQINLHAPGDEPDFPDQAGASTFHLMRELKDMRGQPVRILDVFYISPELQQVSESDRWEAMIFLIYGVLAIGTSMFFAQLWVLQPLKLISKSLTLSDTGPLEHLLREKSEMGRVANLVKTAFQNRVDLREALDERARLGRDLHDGVIQTLYASGMSLAGIQATMRQNPAEAEQLIDQTRRELNATIRDVRNFITGLEPESMDPPSFAKAVQVLLDFMKGGAEIECTTAIDEQVDELLSLDTRAQFLQIVREAASNAFRHSSCTTLHVALSHRPNVILLEITDNGCGFDPANLPTSGRGLDNFSERAEAMHGKLDIISRIGQGATIRFEIPADSNA
ncbi:MAG: hypothetical protein K9N01_02300 [Cephaloticoccus sp.]|nr:hypothetical protein [Cephaloticoccus sp.]